MPLTKSSFPLPERSQSSQTPSSFLPPPNRFDRLSQLDDYYRDRSYVYSDYRATEWPFVPRVKRDEDETQGAQLMVCHDYKGGYKDEHSKLEREYTFNWWHMIDTFIYFSHATVTIPPPGWIIQGHRHGVRVLGTLIFEWDPGREDIIKLVLGPEHRLAIASNKISVEDPFSQPEALSTHYADLLVRLVQERGFDGLLLNVEVPLGVKQTPNTNDLFFGLSHSNVLLDWISYLRQKLLQVVGDHAQIIWYDAVTTNGKLSWQNQVTEFNKPFFEVSDGIFLNYHWRGPALERNLRESDCMISPSQSSLVSRRQDIYVGIDNYGRGSLGWGYVCWKALELISKAKLSVALFGPGWVAESDLTSYDLSVEQKSTSGSSQSRSALDAVDGDYSKWLADERWFWAGSSSSSWPSSSNNDTGFKTMQQFLDREYNRVKEREQLARVRMIAQFLATGMIWLVPGPPPLAYEDTREQDKRSYRSVGHFHASKKPPSLLWIESQPNSGSKTLRSFYTNFSLGSGAKFFVEGADVLSSQNPAGWTDIEMGFQCPDLVYPFARLGCLTKVSVSSDSVISFDPELSPAILTVTTNVNDGWIGSGAPRVRVVTSGTKSSATSTTQNASCYVVPLCSVDWNLIRDQKWRVSVVWKPLSTSTKVRAGIYLGQDHPSSGNALTGSRCFQNGILVACGSSRENIEACDSEENDLTNGWKETVLTVTGLGEPVLFTSIGVVLNSTSSSESIDVLVGQLCISPTDASLSNAKVTNLRLETVTVQDEGKTTKLHHLNWDVDNQDSFISFFIFSNQDQTHTFLGTSTQLRSAREFTAVDDGAKRLIVRGWRKDGTIENVGSAQSVSL